MTLFFFVCVLLACLPLTQALELGEINSQRGKNPFVGVVLTCSRKGNASLSTARNYLKRKSHNSTLHVTLHNELCSFHNIFLRSTGDKGRAK